LAGTDASTPRAQASVDVENMTIKLLEQDEVRATPVSRAILDWS
jgi:hypothetical protein